jgi:hypothetical protein
MSRYDDLRRMREVRFAAAKTFVEKPPATVTKPDTKPVTNPPEPPVTKPISVTKLDTVTKPKGGRPRLGDKPMTPAERMRRYRARIKATELSSA